MAKHKPGDLFLFRYRPANGLYRIEFKDRLAVPAPAIVYERTEQQIDSAFYDAGLDKNVQSYAKKNPLCLARDMAVALKLLPQDADQHIAFGRCGQKASDLWRDFYKGLTFFADQWPLAKDDPAPKKKKKGKKQAEERPWYMGDDDGKINGGYL